jgi:Phage antitermination protein Q.
VLAEYIEVEEHKEIVKPVTRVHFKADYDITDVLRLWGNWSRKDYYSEQKTPNFYNEQSKQYKEICSDEDAMIIDAILISLSKVNKQSNEQYKILKLFYFGEVLTIEDYVATTGHGRELERLAHDGVINLISMKDFNKQTKNIIKPLSVVDIAKKVGVGRAKIKSLKEGGENHVIGHLNALTMLTGEKLEILNNIKNI